ncbi:sterol 24-C-methyltransferase [Sugiyamaella lignohabitans]|uniref:Sterol 24-C-methyltransferase n=1 Tax=Sugiyamaella lignohabitans TaxID=796027 RepID=A0A161HFZ4_9ASCO|nr:sterol 24-C-methyltransferase [Sugiyamaella lignohabitans]ANB14570.1 sterol 24-C-methyltransferase [Sugiyamaella lignohabitans]
MSTAKLAPKDFKADAEFAKAMHGSGERGGFTAVLSKNRDAQQAAVDGYFKHWDNKGPKEETEEDKQARLDDYSSLTKHYYNLVTDFYEYGWGSSFHFSRYYPGEAFKQATARHEHYLALKMGINENMKVLDVGCGVGGPAREIHRFTGAEVVGLNNNDYQISRGNAYAKKFGLENKLSFVKGDFMQMDFPDNSFDAVYAIEATVHAPDLAGVYGEIYRVLKPGGTFGVYEWVLTDNYDESNARHREIAYGIEIGDGIPKMFKSEVAEAALKKVGFEIVHQQDMADVGDKIPWYYPLTGDWKYIQTLGDFFTFCRTSKFGRMFTMEATGLLEKVGVAPKGSKKVTIALEEAAVHLVNGAKEGLFTPMMLYVCKKAE